MTFVKRASHASAPGEAFTARKKFSSRICRASATCSAAVPSVSIWPTASTRARSAALGAPPALRVSDSASVAKLAAKICSRDFSRRASAGQSPAAALSCCAMCALVADSSSALGSQPLNASRRHGPEVSADPLSTVVSRVSTGSRSASAVSSTVAYKDRSMPPAMRISSCRSASSTTIVG